MLVNNFISAPIPGIDGDGTVGSPYQIKTIDDLRKIAKWTNKDESQPNGYDPNSGWQCTSDKHFKLMNEITDEFDMVIGTGRNPFKGDFNGNSKGIKLNINEPRKYSTGLFGYVDNARIYKLSTRGSVTGGHYSGVIVGDGRNVSVEYCTNFAIY